MQAGFTDHVWTIEELCNLLAEADCSQIDNQTGRAAQGFDCRLIADVTRISVS
jgi:hypothetical protein